jgi:hypothetical protein
MLYDGPRNGSWTPRLSTHAEECAACDGRGADPRIVCPVMQCSQAGPLNLCLDWECAKFQQLHLVSNAYVSPIFCPAHRPTINPTAHLCLYYNVAFMGSTGQYGMGISTFSPYHVLYDLMKRMTMVDYLCLAASPREWQVQMMLHHGCVPDLPSDAYRYDSVSQWLSQFKKETLLASCLADILSVTYMTTLQPTLTIAQVLDPNCHLADLMCEGPSENAYKADVTPWDIVINGHLIDPRNTDLHIGLLTPLAYHSLGFESVAISVYPRPTDPHKVTQMAALLHVDLYENRRIAQISLRKDRRAVVCRIEDWEQKVKDAVAEMGDEVDLDLLYRQHSEYFWLFMVYNLCATASTSQEPAPSVAQPAPVAPAVPAPVATAVPAPIVQVVVPAAVPVSAPAVPVLSAPITMEKLGQCLKKTGEAVPLTKLQGLNYLGMGPRILFELKGWPEADHREYIPMKPDEAVECGGLWVRLSHTGTEDDDDGTALYIWEHGQDWYCGSALEYCNMVCDGSEDLASDSFFLFHQALKIRLTGNVVRKIDKETVSVFDPVIGFPVKCLRTLVEEAAQQVIAPALADAAAAVAAAAPPKVKAKPAAKITSTLDMTPIVDPENIGCLLLKLGPDDTISVPFDPSLKEDKRNLGRYLAVLGAKSGILATEKLAALASLVANWLNPNVPKIMEGLPENFYGQYPNSAHLKALWNIKQEDNGSTFQAKLRWDVDAVRRLLEAPAAFVDAVPPIVPPPPQPVEKKAKVAAAAAAAAGGLTVEQRFLQGDVLNVRLKKHKEVQRQVLLDDQVIYTFAPLSSEKDVVAQTLAYKKNGFPSLTSKEGRKFFWDVFHWIAAKKPTLETKREKLREYLQKHMIDTGKMESTWQWTARAPQVDLRSTPPRKQEYVAPPAPVEAEAAPAPAAFLPDNVKDAFRASLQEHFPRAGGTLYIDSIQMASHSFQIAENPSPAVEAIRGKLRRGVFYVVAEVFHNQHWFVLAFSLGPFPMCLVFDSLAVSLQDHHKSAFEQLRFILGETDGIVRFGMVDCPQQTNPDCALFSTAFAVQLLSRPTEWPTGGDFVCRKNEWMPNEESHYAYPKNWLNKKNLDAYRMSPEVVAIINEHGKRERDSPAESAVVELVSDEAVAEPLINEQGKREREPSPDAEAADAKRPAVQEEEPGYGNEDDLLN